MSTISEGISKGISEGIYDLQNTADDYREAMDWATFCYRATPELCNIALDIMEEKRRVETHKSHANICKTLSFFGSGVLCKCLEVLQTFPSVCSTLTPEKLTSERGQELLDSGAVQPRYRDIHMALVEALSQEKGKNENIGAFSEFVMFDML